MTSEKWEEILNNDGYSHVVTHIDSPGKYYEIHDHPIDTVHVILTGLIDIEMNGEKKTYRAGDRVNIPKHTEHDSRIGPNGCTFLTGIKM